MNGATLTCDQPDRATLIALLSEQRDLYVQLGKLSSGQRGLITGDAPELLLGVLGERQGLIERLEALMRRLRPYQQNWRSVRAALGPVDGRHVDQLVAEVNGLLKGILDKDAADAELLAARKSEAARGVRETRAARHAGAAYDATPLSGSRIDWVDE